MSNPPVRSLLDRPFHRDRLVQLAVVAAVVVLLLNLPRFVQPGGAYNADRAWGLVSLVLQLAFWLWLLLLMVPAWWRRRARDGRARVRAGLASPSWGHHVPGTTGSSTPVSGGPPSGLAAWPTGVPPVFRSVTVRPPSFVAGQRVQVSWDAPGAEQVAVGDLTGLPATGSTTVVPQVDGPLSLMAVNAHGTAATTTAPAPSADARWSLADVPRPPAAPFAGSPWTPPIPSTPRLRLDVVVDQQRLRRETAVPAFAPGPATPTLTPTDDTTSRSAR